MEEVTAEDACRDTLVTIAFKEDYDREGEGMRKLCFEKPAEKWEEAWPVGNGRLGAMIGGGINREILQLNQDSMYYGGPMNRINPDARPNLEKVRNLLLQERIAEAEKLLCLAFSGTPQSQRPYQPLGELELRYAFGENSSDRFDGYCRELSLEEGVVTESFSLEYCHMEKEYFASFPEGVLVMKIEADKPCICLEACLSRQSGGQFYYDRTGKKSTDTIFMEGVQGQGGVAWCAAVKACVYGGNVSAVGEHLLVQNAEKVVLYLGCETSFYEASFREVLYDKLEKAAQLPFPEVRRRHVEDYRKLFARVLLEVEAEEKLITYFQFCRYLMISASRPGSLMMNLQGIWNAQMEPGWGCRYTLNINAQMNYWPAELTGLSECHMPLLEHLLRMWESGKKTAEEMYGCRGFAAHHSTDLWGDCAPQDVWIPSTYWVMGGAWLCTHIWQHYQYTYDKEFLQKYYPLLKDAVLFFHDFLIEADGFLMTCPSLSPENSYLLPDGTKGCCTAGATVDGEILRDLMEDYLAASDVLQITDADVARTKEMVAKLPPLRIGKYGQIMEWRKDYEEEEPGHRHVSHLYALCPSHQITPEETPVLAEAARTTLDRRLAYGSAHTGWSCAWIANLYARLMDGEKALEMLTQLYEDSTFPNLMDKHPHPGGAVFQIDGNMGGCAAIAELFIQSREDKIFLLPALPAKWKAGKLTGFCVGKGSTIDLTWKEGEVNFCLHCPTDQEWTVICGQQRQTLSIKAAQNHSGVFSTVLLP